MTKTQQFCAAIALALSLPTAAFAQQAGVWSLSVGATQITPADRSHALNQPPGFPAFPGAEFKLGNSTELSAAVSYMLTDHLAVHVPLTLGFKFDVRGAALLQGVGKLAEIRALPITVMGQYRFLVPQASFRPYVGAGVSYVRFYKERGNEVLTALTNPGGPPTGLSLDSKLVPSLQVGAVYSFDKRWFVQGSHTKTLLKTKATLTTGHTADLKLDPSSVALELGYRF